MEEKQKNLPKEPEILERIQSVRMRLGDTDRDDHVREVDRWEEDAKKALIIINLSGHEGIKIIVERAQREIREINWTLVKEANNESDFAYDPNILISKQLKREDLLKMRRLWEWFLELFGEAEETIKRISSDLLIQESDEIDDQP